MSELSDLLTVLEAEEMRRSLRAFVEGAWSVVEPADFVGGFALDAICLHLEALTRGDLRFLLITVPPRHTKSTVGSVLWPIWDWLHHPSDRFLCASYSLELAIRDNAKKRVLVESPWFQQHYIQSLQLGVADTLLLHTNHDFALSSEQNAKRFFMNTALGYQLACSVGSSATGQGGSKLCIPSFVKIMTENGAITIGELVEKRMQVKVMAYREIDHSVRMQPITGYSRTLGYGQSSYKITTQTGETLQATEGHPIAVGGKGFTPIQELSLGDYVLVERYVAGPSLQTQQTDDSFRLFPDPQLSWVPNSQRGHLGYPHPPPTHSSLRNAAMQLGTLRADGEHAENRASSPFGTSHGPMLVLQAVPIVAIEPVMTPLYVYNIEVAEDHSYIANGIVVHNCIDDPHAASEAHSQLDRENAITWFRETWSNRMNNPKKDCMLVIGQRIHEDDVAGHILRERGDWTHLNLPAEYDPRRQCVTPLWKDPRQEDGELLWPERFPHETLERYKRDLGAMGYAAQYQQLPVPAGGAIFKKEWFRYYRESGTPSSHYTLMTPQGTRSIPKKACWRFGTVDLAISQKQTADFTVIQIWDVTPTNDLLLIEQIRGRFDNPEQQKHLRLAYLRYLPDYLKIEASGFQLAAIQQLRQDYTRTTDFLVQHLCTETPQQFERDILMGFPQLEAYLKTEVLSGQYSEPQPGQYIVRVLGDADYFVALMQQQGYCTIVGHPHVSPQQIAVPIQEYRPVRDKVARASIASIFMENSQIFFLEGAQYLRDLEHELLQFPRGSHDDQADALTAAADTLATPRGPLQDDDSAPLSSPPPPPPSFPLVSEATEGGLQRLAPPLDTQKLIDTIDPFTWIDRGQQDHSRGLYHGRSRRLLSEDEC